MLHSTMEQGSGHVEGPMTSDDDYPPMMENLTECIPVRKYFAQVAVDTATTQTVLGLLYGTVWLMAVASNLLLLIVVAIMKLGGRRRRRDSDGRYHRPRLPSTVTASSFSVRIVFVVSLACSDLLTSLTSLPVTAVNILTHVWPFPAYMCHCIGFFQGFSIFQSSFTFTSIAVDRYLLVFYPDHAVVTYGTARCGVALMAVIAATLALPMFIFVEVRTIEPVCGRFCVENWPENSIFFSQRVYGLFVLILQFGLPCVVTCLCYVMIANRLRSRCSSRSSLALSSFGVSAIRPRTDSTGEKPPFLTALRNWIDWRCGERRRRRLSSTTGGLEAATHRLIPSAERRSNERRRRANRMMAAMVTAFVLLWLPFNTLNILRDFDLFDKIFDQQSFSLLYSLAHLIAMTTLVWNPIIYAWFNKSLRSAVKAVFHCSSSSSVNA